MLQPGFPPDSSAEQMLASGCTSSWPGLRNVFWGLSWGSGVPVGTWFLSFLPSPGCPIDTFHLARPKNSSSSDTYNSACPENIPTPHACSSQPSDLCEGPHHPTKKTMCLQPLLALWTCFLKPSRTLSCLHPPTSAWEDCWKNSHSPAATLVSPKLSPRRPQEAIFYDTDLVIFLPMAFLCLKDGARAAAYFLALSRAAVPLPGSRLGMPSLLSAAWDCSASLFPNHSPFPTSSGFLMCLVDVSSK